MIKLAALWQRTDKNGNIYFTGKLGDAPIVIMKNGYKKEDKQPDFIIYVSEPKAKEKPNHNANPDENYFKDFSNDDINF